MAKNIKGITIEVDGDTTGLTQALKKVDSETKSVQTELKAVDRLLKFDPTNITLLVQKQELLGNAVDNTKKRLDTLKQAQVQVEQQFRSGEIGADQYRAFQREIAATEGKLLTFQKQLKNVGANLSVDADTSGIDKMKSALKELPSAAKAVAKEMGDALKTAGAAGTAAVGALVLGSNDLNSDLARLRTNAEMAGRDLGLVEEAFKQITAVTGETDSAVETISNLLASGFTDEQLSKVIDNVNGAAIRFSDTLKTEGIADGIQETFATGAAIGPFAELLERSGVDLDTFNEGLEKAKKGGEGANYILEQMSKLGLAEVSAKYQELNPEVTKNAEATINMQTALAELAIVLTPLVTMITEVITKFVEWASNNPTLATTLAIVSGAITGIVGIFTVLSPIISAVTSLWPVLAGAIGAISAPVAAVIAGIAALIAIGVALWKNWDEISAFAKSIWGSIKDFLAQVWESIKNTITSVWDAVSSYIKSVWDNIKNIFDVVLTAIKTVLDNYWDSMKSGIEKVWNGIKTYFEGAWELIKNIFLGALLVIIDLVTGNWDSAKSHTEQIWNNIKDALLKMWEGIKSVFSGALEAVSGYVKTHWDNIKNFTSTAWQGIKTTISNLVEGIKNAVRDKFIQLVTAVYDKMNEVKKTIQDIWGNVTKFLKSIDLKQIGIDIIRGLINGIGSMANSLKGKVEELATNMTSSIKKILGIHSPSRVFKEIGLWTGEGLVIGINQSSPKVNKAMEDIGNGILNVSKSYQKEYSNLIDDFNKKNEDKQHQTLEKINKIRDGAAKKKRALTQKEQQEIARLEASYKDSKLKSEIDFQKKYKALVEKSEKEYFDVIKKYVDDKKSLNDLSIVEEAKIWEQSIEFFKNGTKERIQAQQAYKDALKNINSEIVSINEEYSTKILEVNENLKEREKQLTETYTTAVDERAKSLKSFTGLFDEFDKKFAASGTKLLSNLQSQVDGFKMWQEEIEALSARAIDEGLLEDLREMGPNALAEVMALNEMTDDELTKYSELYREKSELARNQAISELEGMKQETNAKLTQLNQEASIQLTQLQNEWKSKIQGITKETEEGFSSMNDIGVNAMKGLSEGLESMEPTLKKQAKRIADDIRRTIEKALDIHSPSRVMRGIGEFVGEGLILGMSDMLPKVANASIRLSEAVGGAFSSLSSSAEKSAQVAQSTSTSTTTIDKSRNFNLPAVNIYTQDNGAREMERTLRRMVFGF